MGLNVLQLSQVAKRRYAIHMAECFLGGMIGAMGAIVILGWIL